MLTISVVGAVIFAAAGFVAGYLIGWVRGHKGYAKFPRPGDA
jgi:hypothetical protein